MNEITFVHVPLSNNLRCGVHLIIKTSVRDAPLYFYGGGVRRFSQMIFFIFAGKKKTIFISRHLLSDFFDFSRACARIFFSSSFGIHNVGKYRLKGFFFNKL